jgi:hypothetical protein
MYQEQDFDHQWANHLLARERALRGHEEDERGPAARAKRADRSGDSLARGEGKVARGAALLGAFFR